MAAPFVCVSGLPRAGSTLLCQLLAEHPDVYCEGHSSPLCNTLLATRRFVSDDQFFLSQLDVQFDTTYANLQSAMRGFLHGWYEKSGKKVVVDKNRAWLQCIEFLLNLEPEARLLVSIRDLGQIYGSIEAQHQKTILVDFADHLADYDRLNRASVLFSKEKMIGMRLASILATQDLPDLVKKRIFFVRFENLVTQPVKTMTDVYTWLGLRPISIDPDNLKVRPHSSDSHYRNKFIHRQHTSISPPKPHVIPPRIQNLIGQSYAWYYEWFYPKPK